MPTHKAITFAPAATLQTLRIRSELLRATRDFFAQHDYWEVQTPVLSRDVLLDAHLDPFVVPGENLPCNGNQKNNDEWFLQTSPEFAMKRLIAAGAEAIYQIAPAFRRGEIGRLHNTEFTMVEWYRVGVTYHEQIDFTEQFVRHFFETATQQSKNNVLLEIVAQPFDRLRYDDAFQQIVGQPILSLSASELETLATKKNVVPPSSLHRDDVDEWRNLLLAELVEPQLGVERPMFLYDYPASQAALAMVREPTGDDDSPPVAERFELYINGIELCNGYHELTDPSVLRERNRQQVEIRRREQRRELPEESRLLAAMEHGLPACAGVALGFDRLLMLALGATTLHDVLAFPADRA